MFPLNLKKSSGAIALTLIAILIIAVLVCINAPFSYAESASDNDVIDVDFITANYYNFGEIVSISATSNSFATLEIIDENLYLRVIPDNVLVLLNNTNSENYRGAEVIAFSDRVFVKQDDGIYIYIVGESSELVKYLDLTFEYTVLDETVIGDYKSFGGANIDNVLIVDYNSIIIFFDITKNAELPVTNKIVSSNVVGSNNGFDRMLVENTSENIINLHLYDSKTGNRFNRSFEKKDNKYVSNGGTTQQNLDVLYENKDLYTFFNGGLCLKNDGLYKDSERVVKINSDEDFSISDNYIQSFSKMSVGGDNLYIIDNIQCAVKVFDTDYNLTALYGSAGDGITENQSGLTRFRNPKYLSCNDEHLALFDEGNNRIVLLDHNGNVNGVYEETNVIGLVVFEGIWYITSNKVVKLSYDMEEVVSIDSENTLISIITDQTHVYVKNSEGVFKMNGSKSELMENVEFSTPIGGKHDGVIYSIDNNAFTMLKDGKSIISNSIGEYKYFAVDYQGNVIYGKGNKLTLLTRKLDGFDTNTYTTEISLNDLVITDLGTVFALSDNALVKVGYTAVSSEATFQNPEKSYPYSAIKLNETIYGYTRPDNYESVVEVEENAFVLFATTNYLGNKFYFTELLRGGKYIDLYIPEESAVILENKVEDNQYIKYGGMDANPCAYAYPSNSATPVCNIDKDTSYQVIRLIAEEWNWYELEINGIRCYVNAGNYITAEPPYITVDRYYMRAKADALGQQIALYASPEEGAEIIAMVGEGFVLELTEPYNKDSEYLQVRYNKGIAYVKTANIQKDGLTEGQKFALCFAGVVVGLTAIFGILSLSVRRRKVE